MSILKRLKALEDKTPAAVVIEVRTPSGEKKRVSAAEYEADPTLAFVRLVSGSSFAGCRLIALGNQKRAEFEAVVEYAGARAGTDVIDALSESVFCVSEESLLKIAAEMDAAAHDHNTFGGEL